MADVREFHGAIVQSVKTPDVVSQLVSAGVISPVDGDQIKGLYLNNETLRANEEMLKCFYKSNFPKKTDALLLVFKQTGYSFLKGLMEGTDYEDLSHLHAKKIIQIFAPILERNLNCGDIISDLYSREVIGDTDREIIMSTLHNKGNTYAMIVLLERMQNRVSPEQWYYAFLDVLMKRNYENLVEQIEPDFIENPSSYMPKLGPIYTDSGAKSPNKGTVHLTEGGAGSSGPYGSIHEHVLEDYGECQTVSNDLGAPPAPSGSSYILTPYSPAECLTNLKELNIKPELSVKDLSISEGHAWKNGATADVIGSNTVLEHDGANDFKAVTNKPKLKLEVEEKKKGKKSDDDYEILCKRCKTVACYASDVMKIGTDHIVIDKEFKNKITRKPHNKPKIYDGVTKKFKMYCKKCPMEWGTIGIRDELECMILKIQNFKFHSLRTKNTERYEKWTDFPYKVPEIKLDDLPKLLDLPVNVVE